MYTVHPQVCLCVHSQGYKLHFMWYWTYNYIKVNKFATFQKCNETTVSMGMASVMKCVVKKSM